MRTKETVDEYQVGQTMILKHSDGAIEPTRTQIVRTTKTLIVVNNPRNLEEELKFKKEVWGCMTAVRYHEEALVTRGSRYASHHKWQLYDETEGAMEQIKDEIAAAKMARIEKDATKAKERQERQDRYDLEMAEAREANGDLFSRIRMQQTNPDGSRFYVLNVAIKKIHHERKQGYEIVIVLCRDTEDYDFEKCQEWLKENGFEYAKRSQMVDSELEAYEAACTVKRVAFTTSYNNGSFHSFSSVSTDRADTDEEALWEAVRYCYHNW